MNQPATETGDMTYILVFYGSVPGLLMARVAYRHTDRRDLRVMPERKIINCPYCKTPLTDVDRNAKVLLYHNPIRKRIRCQIYPVCQNCKNKVGIILA